MNRLEIGERWAIAILLVAALLTFFFPLVSIQIPIIGNQSWSGYDVFSRMSTLDKQMSSIQPKSPVGQDSLPEQTDTSVPETAPSMPISVQLISLIPFEIAFALGFAFVSLMCCLDSSLAYRVRAFSVVGSISAIIAILHLTITNSDLHSWFQGVLTATRAESGDNLFAGLAQELGSLVANSIQIRAGIGLSVLAALLVLVSFLSYSRILKRRPE